MADWSEFEVDLIIEDYFQMLHEEIRGVSYNKAAHRNKLSKLLNNRDKAIEFKHQNISAILINNGLPYIVGYKPLKRYQKLLEDRVLAYISKQTAIEIDFEKFATQKVIVQPKEVQYNSWVEKPPPPTTIKEKTKRLYKPVKRNYLEIEQRNRSIGSAGEELVLNYEKWRLTNAGFPKLAKEVKWISKDFGDGAGYDILSRTVKGSDIFIEVKTTTLGIDTPIFFSSNENDFSNEKKEAFYLYRVFDIKHQPRMFFRTGSFKDICNIEAVNFKGTF